MSDVINFIKTQGLVYGLKIVSAIVIFFVGKWVAKLLTSWLEKILTKKEVNKTLTDFLLSLTKIALITFVIIAALGALGIQTASFVAILGAAGLAVGFALQGSLANFAAGVLIIFFKPYEIDDVIEAAGKVGKVSKITIFNTILLTPDNTTIIIPNNNIMSGVIVNYTKQEKRRIDLVFGIGYDDDIKKAKGILESILKNNEKVLKDPAPAVFVKELGDSSVNLAVRPWVKTEDYWTVMAEITEAVKYEFDKNGISIPYPQHDVHLINEETSKTVLN